MADRRDTPDEGTDAVDDYLEACYAEWLMQQPEAQITGGDKLVERMEQQWGWLDFLRQFKGG